MAEKDKDPDATARLAIGLVVTVILGWMAFGPDRSEARPVSEAAKWAEYEKVIKLGPKAGGAYLKGRKWRQ